MDPNLRCGLHVWEHNYTEPENGSDAEKDIGKVYEYVFFHNHVLGYYYCSTETRCEKRWANCPSKLMSFI